MTDAMDKKKTPMTSDEMIEAVRQYFGEFAKCNF